ncbi:hypothetical protein VHEMI02646 [[Torrubiella] hemipterigena]|uniref:Uncharacterized protein n=1 Tax=[Torrubiella] hemipterigena TaxID=1531966 RepID=A0A0A1SWE2_9HYPO|nr:hypothetical protein VHEMI02646 [[Torrubiella] hemipterigena]
MFWSPAGYISSITHPDSSTPEPQPFLDGTVRRHQITHNLPARNGTWRTYPLSQTEPPYAISAWFVAHETVDPITEITKVLRVAGSPYEYDCGSRDNNAVTREECVLLVNRYDWKKSERNETDTLPSWLQSSDPADKNFGTVTDLDTIGVIDYTNAMEAARSWSEYLPNQRLPSPNGLWMDISNAEYIWARAGFDDRYSEARSLLCFTQWTSFFKTSLPGHTEPLRMEETDFERYQRGVHEGRDYSGLAWLRENETRQPELQDPTLGYLHEPPTSNRGINWLTR